MLEPNFRVNVMGLLHLARRLAPAMIDAGAGAIVATGNTSALRGKADFAGFAPTKAAQRILAESMARHLGPQGVHVAYVVIDAVIDLPWTRQMMHARLGHEAADDFFIRPQAIADEIWHVVQQPPLRPGRSTSSCARTASPGERVRLSDHSDALDPNGGSVLI